MIYTLVAIPLVTMLGLFTDVAYTSVTNWINLDRAPSLIKTTSVPMAHFMSTLQAERRAAFVYQSQPSAANRATYTSAITATDSMDPTQYGIGYLENAIEAPATKQAATPQETAAIQEFLGAVTGSTLQKLREGVNANAVQSLTAFQDYTQIIEGIPNVFEAEASSMTDATASTQGFGLISTINAREDISEQDALLAGALAAGNLTAGERVGFVQAAGREQDDEALFARLLDGTELSAYNSTFSKEAPQALQQDRAQVQQGVEAGYPLTALEQAGLTAAQWQQLNQVISTANFNGGLQTADASLAHDQGLANNAHTKVYITGALGLLGLILTLIVTIWLARSINRRLTRLSRTALTLANEHLPSVITRLRRGEHVDVAAEAPPLRVGRDEIGQVGQAFDAVRQTAIASAVEESRLRQGVNDMFRNLARRNQSLLQRQLATLDMMERKATDPEALDDLFKLDHLTTRMRRHAEGLIILSGAPPGRGWSAPVKLIDVMRGAVSEVEDYARVQVATQSRAALSGSAVTDVIHLLAELIENATSLSPPYTQVRVSGESVTNGFVIEIEDRGLGMTPDRLAELNERLVNPPDVNPGNTEQLGLFVVGQLARRHGIQVTLRTSPYGGTSVVALIPRQLVVDDGPAALPSGEDSGARAGAPVGAGPIPMEMPSFTPASGAYSNGFAGNAPNGNGYSNGTGYSNGNGHATTAHAAGSGYGSQYGSDSYSASQSTGGQYGSDSYGTSQSSGGQYGSDSYGASQSSGGQYGSDSHGAGQYGSDSYGTSQSSGGQYGSDSHGAGQYGRDSYGASQSSGSQYGRDAQPGPSGPAGPSPELDGLPLRRDYRAGRSGQSGYPQPGGTSPSPGGPGAGGGRPQPFADVPVVTGIPVSSDIAPPFDVFSRIHRTGPLTQVDDQDAGHGNTADTGEGYENEDGGDQTGLPRRVRQASLAPQLRDSGPPRTGGGGRAAGAPEGSAASLSDMRNTLSAMQRGWQQGRSQSVQGDTEGNPNGA